MWIYQQVLNVGIQVLVLIGLGYLFARFKLLEQAKFLPQCNFIVLMLALPAFNLYLMGIKLDLQNPEPWKSLAAFLLWVFAVQTCTLLYTWRCCGGDAGEAAVVNMVLLMDNYAITGLLALNATLGTKWGTLALLMAMGFFLVIFPFSLAAFEWEKWAVQQHVEAVAEAAAADIEAATAAAAEVEALDATDKGAKTLGPHGHELAMTASPGASDVETPSARPPRPRGPDGPLGNGVADAATLHHDFSAVELTLYPAAAPSYQGPPLATAAEGAALLFGGGGTGGAPPNNTGATAEPQEDGQGTHGFPHESRYCWWSNEDYRPAHPLLGDQGSQPAERSAPPKSQRQRRRRQETLQEQLLRQTGGYVPPKLSQPSSDHFGEPIMSPFQSSAAFPWTGDGAVNPGEGPGAASGARPGTAPPSAVRRPATMDTARSAHSNRGTQVEGRSGTLLTAMFDKMAAAGSGQLPPAMFGDPGRAVPGVPRPEPEKPVRLQDLEFALTHQLSGGTACQMARISRGYTAAAAAATAAAASPDANVRRLLLGATGTPGRSPLASALARDANEAVGPRRTASGTAPAPGQVATSGIPIPTRDPSRLKGPAQPPVSAPSGAAFSVNGGAVAGGSAVGSLQSGVPTALASLDSGDSIGPPTGDFLLPAIQVDTGGAAADTDKGAAQPDEDEVLACPTLTRQGALSAAKPQLPVPPPAGEGRLASTSTPMFSFGRRSQRRLTVPAGAGGGGADAVGGSPPNGPPRRNLVQRSASDTAGVDRTLLKLASGLALESAKRRRFTRLGERTPPLLLDTDTNVMLQLANALSGQEISDVGTASAADKQLVREATKEVVRRHGGVAKAFAAFVSGHPQLWHIVRTLAKNPMIWTIFIAMAVSVSGLRVFLDPASPDYRPEVGWVAGSLSWLNGLVVPMSLFSNGAWMYGKPVLPKGEVIKMLVLLFIKLGVLPLLMAGCAVLVQLDGQHVAAMTVLTLSPAAAASFVLAVQYGKGVELVSLTNIIGNIFLTPLIILWLKVLAALNIQFTLHEDA